MHFHLEISNCILLLIRNRGIHAKQLYSLLLSLQILHTTLMLPIMLQFLLFHGCTVEFAVILNNYVFLQKLPSIGYNLLIPIFICRPGRLEVQVEISLPDENGRLQILQIHTNKMKENSFLAADVNLQELGLFSYQPSFEYF